ncbi:hypothetical protein CKO38_17870 [Rhodospirillum rubrum]|nr:hypothetical protein [Rhodospirillum rubrum]MBK1678492.1 hypothetical protein [Rhodospirillum rubrum]
MGGQPLVVCSGALGLAPGAPFEERHPGRATADGDPQTCPVCSALGLVGTPPADLVAPRPCVQAAQTRMALPVLGRRAPHQRPLPWPRGPPAGDRRA